MGVEVAALQETAHQLKMLGQAAVQVGVEVTALLELEVLQLKVILVVQLDTVMLAVLDRQLPAAVLALEVGEEAAVLAEQDLMELPLLAEMAVLVVLVASQGLA
jgi:hypothetical protein